MLFSFGDNKMVWILQTNETLKTLQLNGNAIGNDGGMHFAQALQVNDTLENLDLGHTGLVSVDINSLFIQVCLTR